MVYVSRIFPSGDYLISRDGPEPVKMRYSGYSRQDALKEFRAHCRYLKFCERR